jgi:hypothetical protein
VLEVTGLEPGDAEGLGSLRHTRWRSRLPYDVVFDFRTTRVERPHFMEGVATGELDGRGRWRLLEGPGTQGPGTVVLYEWSVRTTRRWMNALAPFARPLFTVNHDAIMRAGGRGLARRLGVELLASD